MKKLRYICITGILLLVIVACQRQPQATRATLQPFPTMTVGQAVSGALSDPRPVVVSQSNPATVVALANRPTATPDTGNCPVQDDETALIDDEPASRAGAVDALLRFLNGGGTPASLREGLENWGAIDNNGYLRAENDVTGDGTPELILGYTAPGDVGTLLIFGCEAGRYVQRYEATADGISPPEVVWLDEMNANGAAELVIASRQCSAADTCEFLTQILTWEFRERRFVNLLDEAVLSFSLPQVRDMDDDRVTELILNLDNAGTSATGPLRTGVNIYDWNGTVYTLSIIQLEPPRYHIQLVHEADKLFLQLEMRDAIPLYEQVVGDNDLRYWFNDGPTTVDSYAYYRLLLAYAYAGNPDALNNVGTRFNSAFPAEDDQSLEERPVYVHLASRFLDVLSVTSDLNEACTEVRDIIEERPEALELLNRYGSRSPIYDTLDVCPF
jgi:hypothetical protein